MSPRTYHILRAKLFVRRPHILAHARPSPARRGAGGEVLRGPGVRLPLPGLRDHVVDRARAHHQHDISRPAQRAQERGGLRERAAIVDGPGTTGTPRTLLDGAHQIVAVYEAVIHLARGLRLDDHHLVSGVERLPVALQEAV